MEAKTGQNVLVSFLTNEKPKQKALVVMLKMHIMRAS